MERESGWQCERARCRHLDKNCRPTPPPQIKRPFDVNKIDISSEVQQIINNTEPRSTKVSPFKMLTGLDMRISGDVQPKSLIQDCLISELDDECGKLRKEARENI